MQGSDVLSLLQSKGESIEYEEFTNIIKMEFAEIDDDALTSVLNLHIPKKGHLPKT